MAFKPPSHLSPEQLESVLAQFPPDVLIAVERIRPHNKREIRNRVTMRSSELRALVMASLDEEHLRGGDLEVVVPGLGKRLVGHHDGVFWLEDVVWT